MTEEGGQRAPEAQATEKDGEVKKQQDAIRKLKARLIPGVKITLLCSLVIYLAILIVGILSIKKCPVNEDIPLFLYIIGFVGLASKLVTYLRDRIIPYFKIKYVESALYSTELVFFLLGTYWVYKEYKPSFDPADGSKYCQKTAYMFAFIYLTSFYAIILGVVIIGLCICCCACLGFTFCVACLNNFVEEDVEANESQLPYIDEEVRENGGNPVTPAQS